jgi:hypothetical protein
MSIESKELKDYVYQRFKQSESKPLRSYYKDSTVKEKMEKALESEFFLTLLLFNNDKFNIAGNYTFAAMYLDEDVKLNKFQKSIVGAFIRFIFEYLGYEEYTRTELNKLNLRWGRLYRKVDKDV